MSIDDTIDTLNDLIETSKDGECGFRESAEYLRDNQIRQLFEGVQRKHGEVRRLRNQARATIK